MCSIVDFLTSGLCSWLFEEFNFSFQLPQGTSAIPRVYASAHSIYLNQKFDSRSEQNGKALFYFTVKYKHL